jgi:Sugar (and other) transporter
VHWSLNLLVSLTFLPLISAIGEAATFWGYAIIAVGTFVYFLMPETKGRSLEQIQRDPLGERRPPTRGWGARPASRIGSSSTTGALRRSAGHSSGRISDSSASSSIAAAEVALKMRTFPRSG